MDRLFLSFSLSFSHRYPHTQPHALGIVTDVLFYFVLLVPTRLASFLSICLYIPIHPWLDFVSILIG